MKLCFWLRSNNSPEMAILFCKINFFVLRYFFQNFERSRDEENRHSKGGGNL